MASLSRVRPCFRVSKAVFHQFTNRPLQGAPLYLPPTRLSSSVSDVAENNKPVAAADGLKLSDACVKRLKSIAEPGVSLRVIIEGGGCSGFQYKFELDNKVNNDDKIFERDGAQLVIDEDSLEFVKGSTVTFQEELIRSSFAIEGNPMAEGGCSCGASFNLKL